MQMVQFSTIRRQASLDTQAVSSNAFEQRVLADAKNVTSSSTAGGTFHHLDRSERLLASSPFTNHRKAPVKQVNTKKKTLEFALLKCFGHSNDEDLDEDHHFKWHSVIANLASGNLFLEGYSTHFPTFELQALFYLPPSLFRNGGGKTI